MPPNRCVQRAAALLLAILAPLTALGCASGSEQALPLSLAELVSDVDGYDEQRVRVSGRVVVDGVDDPSVQRYFVLEDAAGNRVELVPAERVADHVDARVEVEGRFRFSTERGRRIEVEAVRADD